MTETGPSKKLVEGLIAQDGGISESQFEEFRMNLAHSLESLERRAQSSRRATIRSLVAVIICYGFGHFLRMTQSSPPWPYEIIIPIWALCSWIALITAGVLVARYWYKHRPALERGRTDVQIAMFGELQRQIAQLAQRIDDRAGS